MIRVIREIFFIGLVYCKYQVLVFEYILLVFSYLQFQNICFFIVKKKSNEEEERKKERNFLRKCLKVELIVVVIFICGRSNRYYRGSVILILRNKYFNIIKYIIVGFIGNFIIKLDVLVLKRYIYCFNGIYILWIVMVCYDIICQEFIVNIWQGRGVV